MSHLRIGQLLVQSGLLTEDELAEALTAQQIYGGRLGTVLVEHDFVDEDELAEALARQHGMRRVTREHLTEVPADVLATVPSAVATRFQVVPFSLDEERKVLWLAVSDPADLNRQDELQFALERPVELALAPEILLKPALAKHYGGSVLSQRKALGEVGSNTRGKAPIVTVLSCRLPAGAAAEFVRATRLGFSPPAKGGPGRTPPPVEKAGDETEMWITVEVTIGLTPVATPAP